MKTLIIGLSFFILFINLDKKNEIQTAKKYFSYAVSWDVNKKTAYFSPIYSCQFNKGERTQSIMAGSFKSFESQWNKKINAMYNLNLYKYQFGNWHETPGDADEKRDEKIRFFKNKLGYKVYTRHDFSFYPKCK